jgi:hypothetical protein
VIGNVCRVVACVCAIGSVGACVRCVRLGAAILVGRTGFGRRVGIDLGVLRDAAVGQRCVPRDASHVAGRAPGQREKTNERYKPADTTAHGAQRTGSPRTEPAVSRRQRRYSRPKGCSCENECRWRRCSRGTTSFC